MPVILLISAMLIIAVLRVSMPFGAKVEGQPIGAITLSFRERMLLQRTNLYLIGAVILMLAIGGFLGGLLEIIAILATFAVLTIPARYTVTTEGIALNNVVFRSWTDFTGYREERGGVVLQAVERQRNFRMHLLGANRATAMKVLAHALPVSGAKGPSGGARADQRSTAKA